MGEHRPTISRRNLFALSAGAIVAAACPKALLGALSGAEAIAPGADRVAFSGAGAFAVGDVFTVAGVTGANGALLRFAVTRIVDGKINVREVTTHG